MHKRQQSPGPYFTKIPPEIAAGLARKRQRGCPETATIGNGLARPSSFESLLSVHLLIAVSFTRGTDEPAMNTSPF
jgi:hypothetical protein